METIGLNRPRYVRIIQRVLALAAASFGLVTIIAGVRVLAGSDPGYIVFRPLLIYNTAMELLISAAILVGCGSHGDSHEHGSDARGIQEASYTAGDAHGLVLNGSKKWEMDEHTRGMFTKMDQRLKRCMNCWRSIQSSLSNSINSAGSSRFSEGVYGQNYIEWGCTFLLEFSYRGLNENVRKTKGRYVTLQVNLRR